MTPDCIVWSHIFVSAGFLSGRPRVIPGGAEDESGVAGNGGGRSRRWAKSDAAANDDLLAGGTLQQQAEHWFSPIYDVHVLEGVAAGDAFSGAYLHALAFGFAGQEAVDYAIAGSVLKLTIPGDSNFALPSRNVRKPPFETSHIVSKGGLRT